MRLLLSQFSFECILLLLRSLLRRNQGMEVVKLLSFYNEWSVVRIHMHRFRFSNVIRGPVWSPTGLSGPASFGVGSSDWIEEQRHRLRAAP